MKLCLYSSVHGYGHTTRLLAVVQQLLALEPKAEIILNSPVPEWLVAVHSKKAISIRRQSLDVGLVQSDSFTTNIEKTLESIHDLQANTAHLIAEEAKWLAAEKVDLILGDIPPLAGALQAASGLPVWG
ncbi:MAG: glycosyl transferase, partial [Anaerolineae bacterium]|nr:glycosyl transferase [Gloeobacterales cyanobacterium ES-bin-313]